VTVLTPQQIDIVHGVLARHLRGRDVRVYGSRARGNAKPFSDLDLIVMDGEPVPLGVMAAITEEFTESDLPFRVEISHWNSLSESFRESIRGDILPLPTPRPAHPT
jgi:predicted nucleotidyltransferase